MSERVSRFYRIEHEDTSRSLWYKPDGTYEPFIEKLTDGKARVLPMEFDPTYSDYGLRWYSALTSVENAHYWFSDLDAFELMKSDYKLYEIIARDVRHKEHEIMFTNQGVLYKREIPIHTIWDIEQFDDNEINIIGGR